MSQGFDARHDSRRLAGRVALVTGASRGLGRAIAIRLGAAGATVAVAARSETVWDPHLPGTIHETVAVIESAGGKAAPFAVDLMVPEDIDRLVNEVEERLGPISVLVNNAALTVSGRPGQQPRDDARPVRFSQPPSLAQVPVKAYRRHIDVNLIAPYRLMQLTLPAMLSSGLGNIVNISSRAAFEPGEGPYDTPGRPALFAYGSTKAALHVLTQAVAVEGADRGVAANVLIPSRPIATPGATRLLDGHDVAGWASPEEFAEAAAELAALGPEIATGRVLWHADVVAGAPGSARGEHPAVDLDHLTGDEV
jgi:7-alpha-hydroxysteroid dehydrogenase